MELDLTDFLGGALGAAFGGVVSVLVLYLGLGAKWVDKKIEASFSEKLESLKFTYAREIAREQKHLDQEIECLERVFRKLAELSLAVASFVSPLETFTPLDEDPETNKVRLLAEGFNEYEIQVVLQASGPGEMYQNLVRSKHSGRCAGLLRELKVELEISAPFLPDDVATELQKCFTCVHEAWWDKHSAWEGWGPEGHGMAKKKMEEFGAKLDRAKELVRAYLRQEQQSSQTDDDN